MSVYKDGSKWRVIYRYTDSVENANRHKSVVSPQRKKLRRGSVSR